MYRQKILDSWRRRGFSATLRLILYNIRHLIWSAADARVDRRYGTDTRGFIEMDNLSFEHENKRNGKPVESSPSQTFRHLISQLPKAARSATFLDMGCGKGRTMILAAELGFEPIIGVEFSPEIAAVAEINSIKYAQITGRAGLFVRCEDAATTQIPDCPCVFYFYNPFEVPVMAQVAANIHAWHQRTGHRFWIVFLNTRPAAQPMLDLACAKIIARGKYFWDLGARYIDPYAVLESRPRQECEASAHAQDQHLNR